MMMRTSALGLLCCCVSVAACSVEDNAGDRASLGEATQAVTGACSAATLSIDLASPEAVGTSLTLTATGTCDEGVSPEFAFVRYTPGAGWVTIRDWGGSSFL